MVQGNALSLRTTRLPSEERRRYFTNGAKKAAIGEFDAQRRPA
ncbi:hypothetical protein [Affinibrenneria salicis]|nr:hypothetical protein [Affinibrenneria salicis]